MGARPGFGVAMMMRPVIAALALLISAGGLSAAGGDASAKAPARGKRWRAKSASVRLSPKVRAKLDDIATRYYQRTKRRVIVTSGTRTPREQALAMYYKCRRGSRLRIYKNRAAIRPLLEVYDKGRLERWSKAKIVAGMADIIQGQVDRGVYISRHLYANAFDVRSRDMSRRNKRAFRRAAEEAGGVKVVEERRPPHFHCELR